MDSVFVADSQENLQGPSGAVEPLGRLPRDLTGLEKLLLGPFLSTGRRGSAGGTSPFEGTYGVDGHKLRRGSTGANALTYTL
jgi:hypothetical protein